MQARAPGKVILSGEHSVVYGAPALAVAIKKHTYVSFKPVTESKTINTLFAGISSGMHYPLHALSHLKHKLDNRFEQFLKGDLPVRGIMSQPDDLLVYAMTTLMHHLPVPGRVSSTSYLPMPGRLLSESDLPLGAGMGSSASAIAATLVLFEHLLEKPLTLDQRFEMIRFCERLQHGRGSAIDAATVTYGGLNHIQAGKVAGIDQHLGAHWYWIFTGSPIVSTGECVQSVREHFEDDTALWNAFAAITRGFVDCVGDCNASETRNPHIDLIKENHRLLQRIGVVPHSASLLIDAIEADGGAAKISGAGATRGDAGGLVIAYQPDEQAMSQVMSQFPGYTWGAVEQDSQGACYVGD